MKRSAGKATWPGRKQVWRLPGRDVVALEEERTPAGGTPLLECVIRGGRRVVPSPPLERLRDRCRTMLAALPAHLLDADASPGYPVERSQALEELLR
jgi:nicotinate phosphoribosyltransferase